MNKIITLATAASLLALAGCSRDAETGPPVDEGAATNVEAASAGDQGMDASTTRTSGSSSAAAAAGTSASGSETMNPAGSTTVSPTGVTAGGVSDETRANAQANAEATNLHPNPPQ